MSEQYGLTSTGKPRTRPLESALFERLPPPMSKEEAPGYLYYPPAEIWVYAEDYHLVIDVAREIANSQIATRHGTRTTKNRGCNGPLCRKALRDALYGGAKQARLRRIQDLLEYLQERHNEEWVRNLPADEREKLLANAERVIRTAQQRMQLLQS